MGESPCCCPAWRDAQFSDGSPQLEELEAKKGDVETDTVCDHQDITDKINGKISVVVNHSYAADDKVCFDVTSRTGQGKSTFLQTLLNSINVLAGVGILSTPYALSRVGWSGLILLVVLACIGVYTAILLRRCLDSDSSLLTYQDVGHAAFGSAGRSIVSVVLYADLYCVTVEFLILLGDNLAQLLPIAGISVGIIHMKANQIFVVLSALVMLPTVWLRDLRLLAYISAFGVVACVTIVSTIGYQGAFEGVGFNYSGSFLNVSGLPLAVGILTFGYSGHVVFPKIYRSMRKQDDFPKVIVACFTSVTVIYGSIAIFGYLMFGDNLVSQVTLNLPRSHISSKIAIWITVVSPLVKYSLTITPVAEGVEEFCLAGTDPKSIRYICLGSVLRTFIVISQVAVAVLLPFFGYMMALIGSALSCSVMILLPCACYLGIFNRRRISAWESSLSVVIFILGIAIAAAGTFTAIQGIVENY